MVKDVLSVVYKTWPSVDVYGAKVAKHPEASKLRLYELSRCVNTCEIWFTLLGRPRFTWTSIYEYAGASADYCLNSDLFIQ